MVIVDLINSCSNDKVAQAALACIGGGFAERVRVAAVEKGVSVGKFVALAVREFARRSDEATQEALRVRVARDDQPLLRGLREVLETALERDPFFLDDEALAATPPYAFSAARDDALRYH
ncbi:MAG: hypothetical protein AB7F41_02145 [Methylocystis sp.]|uniref:hypothetical protein n=1 Tax=Methylocystis sp. TaxID=1911079 RepID=UPI003D141067